ncbi:MAG: ABC transporter ATP-binding protein [Alphaproteobacteria bacterium]|nr:ABC transporter ATP-binding protein [Alphaproteobacteria bacterium]
MTGPALLRVCNVTKRFKLAHAELLAVDDVSLEVQKFDTLAIVGESGSGKSTLANLIVGSEGASSGAIWLGDTELGARRDKATRRRIALVQQNPYSALNPRKSIRAAIELPMIVHGLGDRSARRRKVDELLRRVHLSPALAARRPLGLSGGERQRVAIARALATDPELLVLDEPTSSLDVSVQAHILALLLELQQELGLTYLFITHDLGVVRVLARRVAVMYQGRVVEEGPVEAIFSAPRHRYTNLLLASIPTVSDEDDGVKLDWPFEQAIAPPPEGAQGCAFRPRCPFAIAACDTTRPALLGEDALHRHACLAPSRRDTTAQGTGGIS